MEKYKKKKKKSKKNIDTNVFEDRVDKDPTYFLYNYLI